MTASARNAGSSVAARDKAFMRRALVLARRARGMTSPNPMVGAVLVKRGVIIGQGWHHRAGEPHGEIETLNDARRRGHDPKGATLYVTLEPCSTTGRTPPCTEAITAAGIRRVVVGATDSNPAHTGKGFRLLKQGGIQVTTGVLAETCAALNRSFNHWIVRRTPLVTVKAAMTLDGKIATARGESKWITGSASRAYGMRLRQEADAVLVGVNTILADNPSLSFRGPCGETGGKILRRIILDSSARTPLTSKVVSDSFSRLTTVVVTRSAPESRVEGLRRKVRVIAAPERNGRIDLRWLLKRLGSEDVVHLLIEGGGEVNASFLLGGHAHRVVFFYAPIVLGGKQSLPGVAGPGARALEDAIKLRNVRWRRLGHDWLLEADISPL